VDPDTHHASAAWTIASQWPLLEEVDWEAASDHVLQIQDFARCKAAMERLEGMYLSWQARNRRMEAGEPFPMFSAGYTGLSHQILAATLDYYEGALVDVRISQGSRVPTWQGATLARAFRGRYFWIQDLGNKNFKKPEMLFGPDPLGNIQDPMSGGDMLDLLRHAFPVVMLCTCAKVEKCHRWVVGEFLRHYLGDRVYHLTGKGPVLTIDSISLQV
jgi:hypothetical protein